MSSGKGTVLRRSLSSVKAQRDRKRPALLRRAPSPGADHYPHLRLETGAKGGNTALSLGSCELIGGGTNGFHAKTQSTQREKKGLRPCVSLRLSPALRDELF